MRASRFAVFLRGGGFLGYGRRSVIGFASRKNQCKTTDFAEKSPVSGVWRGVVEKSPCVEFFRVLKNAKSVVWGCGWLQMKP